MALPRGPSTLSPSPSPPAGTRPSALSLSPRTTRHAMALPSPPAAGNTPTAAAPTGARPASAARSPVSVRALLERFRREPDAWLAFRSRVLAEHAARGGSISPRLLSPSPQPAGPPPDLDPEAAALRRARWVAQHNARLIARREFKATRERERVDRSARALEERAQGERAQVLDARKRAHRQALAQPILVGIAIALRMDAWRSTLLTARKRQAALIQRIVFIQRVWRESRSTRKRKEAQGVDMLHRALSLRLVQRRVDAKRNAAGVVLTFLRAFEGTNEIVTFVQRCRLAAIQIQSAWRHAAEQRAAQLRVVARQWELAERHAAPAIAVTGVSGGMSTGVAGGASTETHVSERVKRMAIARLLDAKLHTHALALWHHDRFVMQAWRRQLVALRERERLDAAFDRPSASPRPPLEPPPPPVAPRLSLIVDPAELVAAIRAAALATRAGAGGGESASRSDAAAAASLAETPIGSSSSLRV